MKVNWILLLGCVVVLAGVSLILRATLQVELPLVRSAVAVMVIFFGVRLLVDAWSPNSRTRWFATKGVTVVPASQREGTYDVFFSEKTIDLVNLRGIENDVVVEVNAIFASTEVLIPAGLSYEVEASAAFGQVQTPERGVHGFGEQRAERRVPASKGTVRLKLNAVFGRCELKVMQAPASSPTAAGAIGEPLG